MSGLPLTTTSVLGVKGTLSLFFKPYKGFLIIHNVRLVHPLIPVVVLGKGALFSCHPLSPSGGLSYVPQKAHRSPCKRYKGLGVGKIALRNGATTNTVGRVTTYTTTLSIHLATTPIHSSTSMNRCIFPSPNHSVCTFIISPVAIC